MSPLRRTAAAFAGNGQAGEPAASTSADGQPDWALRMKRAQAIRHGASAAGHMAAVPFKVYGGEMQFVELELATGVAAVAEAGSMMYMEDGIAMTTAVGDGAQAGVVGAVLSAGKRMLAGESLFITVFNNAAAVPRKIAFAAPTPGRIVPIPLPDVGGALVAQKDAFLVAARGVSIGIAFQKRLGVGFFGGQGFIMERLEGDGIVFVNTGGSTYERTLAQGEVLKAEAGSIVAIQPSVDFDIEYVGSIKSALFGGQGLFFATLRGPGRIWLQSLTLDKLIARVASQVSARTSSTSSSSSAATGTTGAWGGALGGLFGGAGASGSVESAAGDSASADSGGTESSDSSESSESSGSSSESSS